MTYMCNARKARVLILLGWIFLTVCISCTDTIKEVSDIDGNVMAFNVGLDEGWIETDCSENTKGIKADEPYCVEFEKGSVKPFYLHVSSYGHISEKSSNSDESASTRGSSINSLNQYTTANGYGSNYDDAFGLIAYAYTGTWSASSPKIIDHLKISKSGSVYTTPQKYYWPSSSHKVRFYGYAPYGNANVSLTYNASGEPLLNYTVPSTVSEQPDIVIASTDVSSSSFSSPYSLPFQHGLTAVVFAVGDLVNCTLKSIQLKNVYGRGAYSFASGTWSASNKSNYSFNQSQLNFTTDGTTQTTTQNVAITSGSKTLMMVPQTLPADAQLVVTLSTTNIITGIASDQTLTANLGGGTWSKGNTVVYKISSTSINTELTVFPPTSYSYSGGNHKYTVYSYTYKGSGVATVKPWKVEYSTDGGQSYTASHPSFFTMKNASGTNLTDGAQINSNIIDGTATCSAVSGVTSSHATVLANAGTVTGVYDLSTHDEYGNVSSMNTANCYVIKKRGTYKLPLVYGNAIKNGADNPSAYTSSATGSYVLQRFKNHLNADITSPYIYNNANCIPASAKLVWSDANGVITNVQLTSDKHYLQFTMGASVLACCNSVVAVLDASNNIMWSWHIWVTDEDMYSTITVVNNDMVDYQVMPQVLGWCSTKTQNVTYYAGRTVIVKISQLNDVGGTDNSATFTINQNEYYDYGATVADIGYHPFYQWGRKDPFLPAQDNVAGSTLRPLYDASGNIARSDFRLATTGVSLGTAIQEPDMCHSPGSPDGGTNNFNNVGDWMSTYYCNLWSSNLAQVGVYDYTEIVKTIYDPCPVGFTIPSPMVFTGFSKNGAYIVDGYKYYTSTHENEVVNCVPGTGNPSIVGEGLLYDWRREYWNNGLTFYCNPYDRTSSNYIYFPSDGELVTSAKVSTYPQGGYLGGVGHWCHIWCAFPSAARKGGHVAANASANIQLGSGYFSSYGWSVRPVRER